MNEPASWGETSGTAMFTFAFIKGVKNGWLCPKTYGPAARRAWLALCGKLDEFGNLPDICIGTGKKNDHQYCLDRKRMRGDAHGQAPMVCEYAARPREDGRAQKLRRMAYGMCKT